MKINSSGITNTECPFYYVPERGALWHRKPASARDLEYIEIVL
jgi:hypothetical protein